MTSPLLSLRRLRKTGGFTVLELLLAITLLVLLSTSLLALLGILTKDGQALDESAKRPRWVVHFLEDLELDLSLGVEILQESPESLSIWTHRRPTLESSDPRGLLRVRYRIDRSGLGAALLRYEHNPLVPSTDSERRDLLALGVEEFLISIPGLDPDGEPAEIPRRLFVGLRMAGAEQPIREWVRVP